MKKFVIIGLLILLLVMVVFTCLGIGITDISYRFLSGLIDRTESIIIYQVRLPRILGALLVGLGLASAGAVLQVILRNNLAEPYTLGISGGAALGVTMLLLVSPLTKITFLTMPLFGFCGAFLSVALIYLITSRHRFSVESLILSGVVISFICSSLVLLIFSISRPTEIQSVLFFLMGNFSAINYSLLKIVSIPIIICILILVVLAREIDVLSLGDEKASHLGVSPLFLRRLLFLITSVITGCCVAVSGMVGFVGLMMPHIMRNIVGPSSRLLIISSALSGAIFLIICDTLARVIIAPAELPVGVITGIVGGIFFLGIIIYNNRI